MNSPQKNIDEAINQMAEPKAVYGFQTISEDDKLKLDMQRSDTEKFQLFTKMLRRNATLNRAIVIQAQK